MSGVSWKLVHVLEMAPRWMDKDLPGAAHTVLLNRGLELIGRMLRSESCTLLRYETLAEFWIDSDGKKHKSEFRLRLAVHAESTEASVKFVERLSAELCAALDKLEE